MSDNNALLAGFTREIHATSGIFDFHLFVKPDADLDSTFPAYDADCCEFIRVNGWLFTCEDIDKPEDFDAYLDFINAIEGHNP